MYRTIAAFLIILATSTNARAEETFTPPDTKLSLNGLHWLTGSWRGTGLGGEIQEHWLTPLGGSMLGIFRLVREEGAQVTEYVMIIEEPDRIVLRFKHFNADYTTWEGNHPLEFTLVSLSDREAVFHSEVLGQHAPRRITYHLSDEGVLSAAVARSDEDGRLTERFSIQFLRQRVGQNACQIWGQSKNSRLRISETH